jgi:hypothetical protein
MNLAALDVIAKGMNIDRPCAVQGRVAGAKGVWSRALDINTTPGSIVHWAEPCIEITGSQHKITVDYQSSEWPSRLHCIFNLVKEGKTSDSVSLNKQAILCLAHGGVPAQFLQYLLKAGIARVVYPFTQPLHEDYPFLVYHAVERAGGISAVRTRQFLGGQARAYGYGQKFGGDEDMDYDPGAGFIWDAVSGAPASFSVSALELLSHGFHPATCPKLFTDLLEIVKSIIAKVTEDYHIPLPEGEGVEAMVVPGVYPLIVIVWTTLICTQISMVSWSLARCIITPLDFQMMQFRAKHWHVPYLIICDNI